MSVLRTIFICWLIVAVPVAFVSMVLSRHQHRRPQTRVIRTCPPYDQCTPKGDWNHPDCKCWSL